jgi:hypothetical protein
MHMPIMYDNRQQSSLYIATVTACCYLLLFCGGIVASNAEINTLPRAADTSFSLSSTPFEYHNEDIVSDQNTNARQSSSHQTTISTTSRGIHRRRLIQHASLFILNFLADNNSTRIDKDGDFSDYFTVRLNMNTS